MEKIAKLKSGKEIKLKASAFTPFEYKELFNKDIIEGMQRINDTKSIDITFIAEVAYTMARSGADEELPPFREWLEDLEISELLELSNPVIQLWGSNTKQGSTPRKK